VKEGSLETVDVSEFTDFPAVQRQQAGPDDRRKLAFRLLRQAIIYSGKNGLMSKLRRTVSRPRCEEGITSETNGIGEDNLGQAIQ
jgi:hypothetical protein